jgi:hypothetical protein
MNQSSASIPPKAIAWFVAVLLPVAASTAQAKPNFAGTWMPLEGVNPPENLLVTQTATLLTAKAGDDPDHAMDIRLDGRESLQAGGRVRTTAQWQDGRLLVTHSLMSGETVASIQKQVWSLDASGRLVIETSRERDGQTSIVKSVYRRRG